MKFGAFNKKNGSNSERFPVGITCIVELEGNVVLILAQLVRSLILRSLLLAKFVPETQ